MLNIGFRLCSSKAEHHDDPKTAITVSLIDSGLLIFNHDVRVDPVSDLFNH